MNQAKCQTPRFQLSLSCMSGAVFPSEIVCAPKIHLGGIITELYILYYFRALSIDKIILLPLKHPHSIQKQVVTFLFFGLQLTLG